MGSVQFPSVVCGKCQEMHHTRTQGPTKVTLKARLSEEFCAEAMFRAAQGYLVSGVAKIFSAGRSLQSRFLRLFVEVSRDARSAQARCGNAHVAITR